MKSCCGLPYAAITVSLVLAFSPIHGRLHERFHEKNPLDQSFECVFHTEGDRVIGPKGGPSRSSECLNNAELGTPVTLLDGMPLSSASSPLFVKLSQDREQCDSRFRPHPNPSAKTIYELLANSTHASWFFKLISEFSEIVQLLNDTSKNITVFVPMNTAFGADTNIQAGEHLMNQISYHISPKVYDAHTIKERRTISTIVRPKGLGGFPQRLPTHFANYVYIGYQSALVGANIFASNGVIHELENILTPLDVTTADIVNKIEYLSTMSRALNATGLTTSPPGMSSHHGGTWFCPRNEAFTKLGPIVNEFLFSNQGLKYLAAVLKYHLLPNDTVYSDTFYRPGREAYEIQLDDLVWTNLSTLLDGASINVGRYWRPYIMSINKSPLADFPNMIAKDGVVHTINDVLLPPQHSARAGKFATKEITVEDIIEMLAPYMESKKSES